MFIISYYFGVSYPNMTSSCGPWSKSLKRLESKYCLGYSVNLGEDLHPNLICLVPYHLELSTRLLHDMVMKFPSHREGNLRNSEKVYTQDKSHSLFSFFFLLLPKLASVVPVLCYLLHISQ